MLALADDATGALETGARIQSKVFFQPDFLPPLPAVIDTESRHLSPEAAYACIYQTAVQARHCQRIFKKTDSTLRGPIAAEFRALLDARPDLPLVYAPAYPALGRTVRNGRLCVDGVPLEQTAFALDPLNPARTSCIRALLSDASREIVLVPDASSLPRLLAPGRVLVCDGQTDADLAAVGDAVREISCIVAGTGAMASPWCGRAASPLPSPTIRSALLVNGSLHPASQAQIEFARLPDANWRVLSPPPVRHPDPAAIARQLACAASEAISQSAPDAVIVFGGDTLIALLRELGVTCAEPQGEILPGIAVSTIHTPQPLLLISKAGGFGPPHYLARLREAFVR